MGKRLRGKEQEENWNCSKGQSRSSLQGVTNEEHWRDKRREAKIDGKAKQESKREEK
jgi:hypothetical protein